MNTITLNNNVTEDNDNDTIINIDDLDIKKINENFEKKINSQKEYNLHIEYLISGSLNNDIILCILAFFFIFIFSPFVFFCTQRHHIGYSIIALIFMIILCVFLHSNIVKKKKKMPESYYNLDVKYLLPLSSKDLAIFIDNDEFLKEYIMKNNDVIYSQYTLDEIMNVNSEYRSMFDELNLSFDSLLKDDSNYSKFKINKIIKDEQSKIRNIRTENKLNTYKVYYSIENGPTKFKIFRSNREDRDLFKRYLESIVDNEYKRNFLIKDIEKLNQLQTTN